VGEIKEGRGTIIGNAGEYLVVGELLKRGIVAAPAPRNNPGFDVLATNGFKSLNIRVKTKTEAADSWVWICKKDGETIFKNLGGEEDVTVLVDLGSEQTPPEYYVIKTLELDERLKGIHKWWLNAPSKRGEKHNPNNKMRRIGFSEHHKDWLIQRKGAWSLILKTLNKTSSPTPPLRLST
jgi:hypothetical protein